MSVIEFGVAGGAGLLALERITAAIAELLGWEWRSMAVIQGAGSPTHGMSAPARTYGQVATAPWIKRS